MPKPSLLQLLLSRPSQPYAGTAVPPLEQQQQDSEQPLPRRTSTSSRRSSRRSVPGITSEANVPRNIEIRKKTSKRVEGAYRISDKATASIPHHPPPPSRSQKVSASRRTRRTAAAAASPTSTRPAGSTSAGGFAGETHPRAFEQARSLPNDSSNDSDSGSDVFYTPKSSPDFLSDPLPSSSSSNTMIVSSIQYQSLSSLHPHASYHTGPIPGVACSHTSSSTYSKSSYGKYSNYSWAASDNSSTPPSSLASLSRSGSQSKGKGRQVEQPSSVQESYWHDPDSSSRPPSFRSSTDSTVDYERRRSNSIPRQFANNGRYPAYPEPCPPTLVSTRRTTDPADSRGYGVSKRTRRRNRRTRAERMDGILEVDESESGSGNSSQTDLPSSSPTSTTHSPSPSPVPGDSPKRAYTYSAPARPNLGSTASSTTVRAVTLPTPLPVLDGSTPSRGYTSLTLPRAAYTPNPHPGRIDGKVDLTRSGLAQTTMSTISIFRGGSQARSHTLPRPRRLSLPKSLFGSSSATTEKVQVRPTSALSDTTTNPLAFSSHTPPPSKVQSSQVLVQVFAVALDGLDSLLVDDKSGQPDGGYGFIPGRSFAGRAIECGFDVRGIAKGDWVFGLLSLQHSGALAEFVVVDKRRIFQAPTPHQYLTVEQIAMLPLAGIPAHRATRTLGGLMSSLPRRPRALVLNAHDGVGALATQSLTLKGADVVAQVPPPREGEKTAGLGPPEKVKLFGAVDVIAKEPRQAVAESPESEYDFVLDTVGGSNIWHAARTALRNDGQFTTVVGDSQALPSMNAHFKSNFRSLRRAFTKKDHKSIGYEWVSHANEADHNGENIRDALMIICAMAEKSELVPFVTKVLPFEDAPKAFESTSNYFKDSGTVVIRIAAL